MRAAAKEVERAPGDGPLAEKAPLPGVGSYRRREPEKTLLHKVVRENWKTFLAEVAARNDGGSLPGHVTAEFERYLACGILGNGFVRVRCTACGEGLLVAFSCKGRGFCPSCSTRRMQGTATFLLDRVIPHVPVRQWVLSLPFWARLLVARAPLLLTRTLGRALREIFRSLGRRAEQRGVLGGKPGAITFIQFFGGQLNLNPHLHCLVPDGVFVRVDGVIRFEPLGGPSEEELQEILGRIEARVTKLLRPAQEKASDDARPPDPLSLAQAASVVTRSLRLVKPGAQAAPKKHTARLSGFSLHAGVHLHANDRAGLGQLLGYGARPALSQERLSERPDGQLELKMKRPLPDGREVLVLSPLELLGKLAALVPPPRFHLLRFHGVFGPAAKWRSEVVPAPPAEASCAGGAPEGGVERPPGAPPPDPGKAGDPAAEEVPPERRHDSQIPWAELLLRVFREDVLKCPCGGRRRVIAFIKDPGVVKAILEHLGLPTTGPPLALARGAAGLEEGWRDDVPAVQQGLR